MLKRIISLATAVAIVPLTLLTFTASALAASPPHYKAIAWAPSTNTIPYVGVGQTANAAESAALGICREFQRGTPPNFGGDCRGTVWVFNGWLAFYSENAPNPACASGWAWAHTQAAAKTLALQQCIIHHGNTCQLRTDQGTQPFIPNVGTRGGFWNVGNTSLPCSGAQLSQCPSPGTYNPYTGSPPGPPVIYNDSQLNFNVTWQHSVVEKPPPGQVPQWFKVLVAYINHSSSTIQFTCSGVSDPQLDKEWFYRNGKVIGYVPASSTTCSNNPGLTFNLGPGQAIELYAVFHNVPWKGDRIAINWGTVNPQINPRSAFVDPYTKRIA